MNQYHWVYLFIKLRRVKQIVEDVVVTNIGEGCVESFPFLVSCSR